ncbi:MAG: TlpA family protein disulfide reductase, partial [Planctomycetales bacterium]|nr:TlpA family protein disulfide reductase [Planctomycetales bacterium]
IADNDEFKAALESIQSKLHEKMLEECREEIANTQAFPFDFTLPDLDGNDVKLADLKGKFVIVDVWGTWCPPCKKEIPHFIQLLNENKDELVMVGINYEGVGTEEAVAKIRTFVDENGINYPCVIGDEETQQLIPDFQGYPTTLFIDPTGAVRLKIVGYHPYEKLATYLSLLQGKDPAAL